MAPEQEIVKLDIEMAIRKHARGNRLEAFDARREAARKKKKAERQRKTKGRR